MTARTGGAAPPRVSPWFRRLGDRRSASVLLFCFHHAGGAASAFRDWPKSMSPTIEPVAVQLPGRENRILEQPYDRIEPLVDDLVAALTPVCDRPFAFFGQSMGARVALAVTRRLITGRLPVPQALFVASSSAPSLDLPVRGWDGTEADLLGYLRDIGGTPEAILSDADYRAELLSVLRFDLTVIGTDRYQAGDALPVPIHGFAGRDDQLAPAARMQPWASETAAGFELDTVEGGHFFSRLGQDDVIDTVSRKLAPQTR